MFYLFGIGVAFFLAVILLLKKNRSLADFILSAWLFVISVHLFFFYSGISGLMINWPWLLGLHFPFPLLHGPLLFLYVRAVAGELHRFNLKTSLHFVPAVLVYVYLIPFFSLSSAEKIAVYQNQGKGYEWFMLFCLLAIATSGVVYVILTALAIRKHQKRIVNEYSNTERINLAWMKYLLFGIAVIWIFVIAGEDEIIFSISVFFVFFIGVFGIRQVGILNSNSSSTGEEFITKNTGEIESMPITTSAPQQEKHIAQKSESNQVELFLTKTESVISKNQTDSIGKKKYAKSGLTQPDLLLLHQHVKNLMENGKPYCNNELTLAQLAAILKVHPNHLSQVINTCEQKNFYDYINSLRVEEFKQRMRDPENKNYTILAVALDSGFNSKSTFNKYFRQVTGQSPSEFIAALKVQQH